MARKTTSETVIQGGLAGAAATAVMSAAMLGAQRLGGIGRLPPHEIATETLRRAAIADDIPAAQRRRFGWLTHLGFGTVAGALFALLRSRLPLPGSAPAQGALYATLVWLTSYQGWIPILGLLPPATEDRPARQASMLGAHLVYGSVLGALIPARRRRSLLRR
jgi:uncharacterized membrane protein YagU involved in acid resistance